jgi:hypothetical protein
VVVISLVQMGDECLYYSYILFLLHSLLKSQSHRGASDIFSKSVFSSSSAANSSYLFSLMPGKSPVNGTNGLRVHIFSLRGSSSVGKYNSKRSIKFVNGSLMIFLSDLKLSSSASPMNVVML